MYLKSADNYAKQLYLAWRASKIQTRRSSNLVHHLSQATSKRSMNPSLSWYLESYLRLILQESWMIKCRQHRFLLNFFHCNAGQVFAEAMSNTCMTLRMIKKYSSQDLSLYGAKWVKWANYKLEQLTLQIEKDCLVWRC